MKYDHSKPVIRRAPHIGLHIPIQCILMRVVSEYTHRYAALQAWARATHMHTLVQTIAHGRQTNRAFGQFLLACVHSRVGSWHTKPVLAAKAGLAATGLVEYVRACAHSSVKST